MIVIKFWNHLTNRMAHIAVDKPICALCGKALKGSFYTPERSFDLYHPVCWKKRPRPTLIINDDILEKE